MSETSDVVRPTIKKLNGIPGVVAYRIHSGRVPVRGGWMHLGETGTPDIGCTVRGLSVYFECKDDKGETKKAQLKWHARARRAGALVFVVRKSESAVAEVRKILANKLEVA